MNPPCRNPMDKAKYREQYMSNLALQASNDQKNMNANLIYKQTGQTPSTLSDMRTTTEKFADAEGLKLVLRSFLSSMGVMSSHTANEVAQELSPDEIQFFIQYQDFVKTDFKGRNVPAPVFIAYLRKLNRKVEETHGVDYGLQQATGEAVLMSNQQILTEMASAQDLAIIKGFVEQIPERTQALAKWADEVLQRINVMELIIPTKAELARMGQMNPATRNAVQVMLNEALKDIPSKGDLNNEMSMLQLALQNGDEERTREVLNELSEILEVTERQAQHIQQARTEITKAVGQPNLPEAVAVEPQPAEALSQSPAPPQRYTSTKDIPVPDNVIKKPKTFETYHKDQQRAFLVSKGVKVPSNADKGEMNQLFKKWLEKEKGGGSGHGLEGRGLKKKPVERSTGYEKPKAFVQFGKYLLNRHKLDDNILMVRRPCGGGINAVPTEHISSPLTHIFKTLCGGGLPSYETIEGLPHSDKVKLHQVVKHTRFEKLSVPHPTKNDEQKEMDRFDILKGEIMAGNDNKTIVKEFKVMVMKFVQDGRLPRRQGQEILIDLTSLGF